jgi:uncharacterized iron-regulated membrane protein
MVSIITGCVVYRKYIFKVLLFRVPLKFKNWRTTSSGLHRIVGVWSLVFHLIIAVTAFWMLRHTFSSAHYEKKENKYVNAPPINFSIDEMLRRVATSYPEFHPQFLTLPESDGIPSYLYGHSKGVSFFYANYYDEITVDSTSLTAKFLHQKTPREKFDSMMYPVHAGVYGNFLVKIIYCVGGLTPALLAITGFVLWWRRTR